MYIYNLADIMFFYKITEISKFKVQYSTIINSCLNYVQFTSGLLDQLKYMSEPTNSVINSYFFCLPKLWNSLPIIDLSESIALINFKLKNYSWEHIIYNFNSNNFCTYIPYPLSMFQMYHNTSSYKLFFSLNLYPFILHYLFYK